MMETGVMTTTTTMTIGNEENTETQKRISVWRFYNGAECDHVRPELHRGGQW